MVYTCLYMFTPPIYIMYGDISSDISSDIVMSGMVYGIGFTAACKVWRLLAYFLLSS